MRFQSRFLQYPLIVLVAAAFAGCSDDGDGPNGPMVSSATFTVTVTNVAKSYDYLASGAFTTPVGAVDAGPIFPGQAYEFRVGAAPGMSLSFATMFAQSNDLFYAPDGDGIALFDGSGTPTSGDVTDQVFLWDAGTEANEEPGVGMNQAPRQSAPNTGPADANPAIRLVGDGYTYPAPGEVIRVTITPEAGNEFTVRIENVSTVGTIMTSTMEALAVPLSPGVYVVHDEADPLFVAGAPDAGDGLERIAEDGNHASLAAAIAPSTGVATPLSPGVWAVHTMAGLLFNEGAADGGHGLERLAEEGNPSLLGSWLGASASVSATGVFSTPVGASTAAPIFPGESFRFSFDAGSGERLFFGSMFGQSNDLFYAPGDAGIMLFDGNDDPITGDVTGQVYLWDAGTERNQWPGAGPDQAPRQVAENTGATDPDDTVRPVNDGYNYPAANEIIQVVIEAE